MEFAYDDRTQELRERLLAFMDQHVYPAEPLFAEQEEAARRPGISGSGRPSSTNSRRRRASRACGTCSCPAIPTRRA